MLCRYCAAMQTSSSRRTAVTVGTAMILMLPLPSIAAKVSADGKGTGPAKTTTAPATGAPAAKHVSPKKPTPPNPDTTITWGGSGTYVAAGSRKLSNEVCDLNKTPYLVWVLSGTKATSATITLPDSETPYTMVKSNGTKRGYGTFKFRWSHEGYIGLGTTEGTPTVDEAAVTVNFLNAKMRGKLSIEVGCRGQEPMLNIGDPGTGGGTVFYVSVAPFTSTGSACNTDCHYLEFAPAGWAPLVAWPDDVSYNGQVMGTRSDPNIDPVAVYSDGDFTNSAPAAIAVGTAIGTGMSNTTQIAANTVTTGKGQRFAFQAIAAYAGSGSTLGDWFLPSMDELNEFCKYARGQLADLGNTAVRCTATGTTKDTSLGLENDNLYWSSTYGLFDTGQTPGYTIMANVNSSYVTGTLANQYYSTYGNRFRPVRAF